MRNTTEGGRRVQSANTGCVSVCLWTQWTQVVCLCVCDSVKLASLCHSLVEQDLLHLAAQASGFLDRLYPDGRLSRVSCITSSDLSQLLSVSSKSAWNLSVYSVLTVLCFTCDHLHNKYLLLFLYWTSSALVQLTVVKIEVTVMFSSDTAPINHTRPSPCKHSPDGATWAR